MKQTSRLLLVLTIMFATSLFRASGIIGKNPQIELSLLGKYEYFLAGILLADLYLTYIKPEFKKTYSWDLVSISSWCLIPYVWSKPNLSVLLPYVAMLAYWGVFRGVIFNAMLRFLPTVLIGGMCYSIYLYHFLFISLVGSWTIFILTLDNYYLFLSLQVFIISTCSIIGSSVFFVILEKPFMRWKLS
jgi:peptidoglycan/LPS O-acetylase OafA/YrhL